MIGSRMHQQTVMVRVPTGEYETDSAGVQRPALAERPWVGCNVQPASTSEDASGATVLVTTRWRISGPLEPWITDDAEVQFAMAPDPARWYSIDGTPGHYTSGVFDHTELLVVTTKGA